MTGEAPIAASSPTTEVPILAGVDSSAPDVGGRTPWSQGGLALAIGSVGVVFGDIGTSPLYAMREALAHARHGADGVESVFGVVSLIIWTLVLIVMIKYVVVLLRADNKGEGGTLALMALAQRAVGRRTGSIFLLGMIGAALFFGDGLITPAVSVLSAVEGVRAAPEIGRHLAPYALPVAAGILVALFMVQARGTTRVAAFFGPIIAVWFLTLAGLGIWRLSENLSILRALSPWYGVKFLFDNGFLGFVILGSVFLAVTGAEALYTDMGHFGKTAIRRAWIGLVFPCLTLNYLGQGALVLNHPLARQSTRFGPWRRPSPTGRSWC